MREYDWSGWSPWQSLLALRAEKFSEVSEAPGVYAIATTKGKIHRVGGVDTNGLLYVGQSGSLRWRIKAFCDCVEYEKETHVAGWRYNLVKLKRCAPPSSLIVRWFAARGRGAKSKLLDAECELLYKYVLNHCELPPLNYNLGRSLMEQLGWCLERELG